MAETTDNLLTNGNFDNALNDWTVEDSQKIKHDSACYSANGLCNSVRWSGDLGKTISQTISNLEQGYDISKVNVSFTALGCNNEANSSTWCSQGTDYDKVQATIQLYDGTKTETLYLEQILDYNDGTQDYSLSTQTLDTWTTDNTNIDFSITGIDTGDWSGWYAPIVDNINLSMDITETVIPEPVAQNQTTIAEPIEEITVIETVEVTEPTNSVMSDIDLEVSVLNEVILEIPEIPEVEIIEVAVIQDVPVIEELPEINETINVVEPVVVEIEELPEIQEIEAVEDVKEIEEIQIDEVAEQENTEEDMEEPTELVETTMEEDLAEAEEQEAKPKKSEKKPKKQKKIVSNSPNKAKANKVEGNSTQKNKVELPVAYTLITLKEPIKIIETVKLVEVLEYEQDITDYTSNSAWDSWLNATNSNWSNLDSIRPVYTPPSYRRSE